MFGLFKKKGNVKPVVHHEVPLQLLNWRNNMWVVTPDGPGIIFKLGVESEVHLTDGSGHTIGVKIYPTTSLRQAKFTEIPAARRKCSKEQAHVLGYF